MSLEQINKAVEQYNKSIADSMVNGEPRWKYYGVTRKVAQAAINFGGYIVTGTRHFCPLMVLQIDSVGQDYLVELAGGWVNVVQGFTDQYGVFMTRKEACVVAREAGQLSARHNTGDILYSESYI